MIMAKLTRDEERFKSCLKKSRSKVIYKGERGGQIYWFFKDVEQTGFHPDTIGDLIRKDLVTFGLMTLESYHNAKWIGV